MQDPKTKEKKMQRKWYMDLDSELVIKNLIFFCFYALMLIAFVNYLILPAIKKYKLAVMEEKKQKIVYDTVVKNFNAMQGSFSLLDQKNKTTLTALSANVTSDRIKGLLGEYFEDIEVKVSRSREVVDKNFIETEFEVQARAKDLRAVQAFFSALRDASMNLRLSIPFVIQKQGNGLFVAFKLKNKRNTYKMLQ